MSKYTTEVRYICEQAAGLVDSVGYEGIDNVLDKAREKIFDFDFPIFDENYRETLENKILKHYYTREIGVETVGLWKHFLCTRMNEIMPYYNQMYKSTLINFNPMYDVDLTTDYQKVDNTNRDKEGTYGETIGRTETIEKNEGVEKHETGTYSGSGETDGSRNSTTTDADVKKNDRWEYFSDTPEGGINGVADLSYLTNARHITDDGTGSTRTSTVGETIDNNTSESGTNSVDGTTTINGVTTIRDNTSKSGNTADNETIKNIEDYLHHVVGKSGGISYSKLLEEFRRTFLNIDMLVIKDLGDLFMNVW